MEAFIIYIAKSAVCLGIFLVIYSLFLRPMTFFRFNRLFLLFGFLASLVIPLVKYTYEVVIPSTVIPDIGIVSEAPVATPAVQSLNVWIILSGLYLLGMLVLAIRNSYAYYKLRKLVKSGIRHNDDGFKIIENTSVNTPFTVLNYILLNTGRLTKVERDLILQHEITHITQRHWVDLLCSECMLLLQWFNPLAWIYVRFLKENHEFLADKAVIDSGVSPALYQAVLINQKFQGPVFSFSNSFNYSKPLNRLVMIKKAKSSPWKRLFVLAVIPVFGLFVWASAEPDYVFVQSDVSETLDDSVVVVGYGSIDKAIADSLNRTKSIVLTKRKGSAGSDKDSTEIKIRVAYTMTRGGADPVIFIDGKKSDKAKMESLNPADIESVSVLKDAFAVAIQGGDAKQGVIHIKTKEYVKKHSEQRNDDFNIIAEATIKMSRDSLNRNSDPIPVKIVSNRAVVYLDGVKTKNMDNIKRDDIESISVLKDSAAISRYGAEGKNGVIIITSKRAASK